MPFAPFAAGPPEQRDPSGSRSKPRIPRYAAALDFDALWQECPPPDEYFEGAYQRTRDELRAIQNDRFLRQMKRAWQVPFYQQHWGSAGMEAGDIKSVDDLEKIPPFSVHD